MTYLTKFYLIYFFVPFLLLGCSNSNNNGIISTNGLSNEYDSVKTYNLEGLKNLEEKTIKMSEIANRIKYIPLETSASCIIKNAFPKITKDDLFVQSRSLLYRFSKSGKYLNSIGKIGKGPGEYIVNYGYAIDENEQRIYIRARSNKIIAYSFDGEFIHEFKIPGPAWPGLEILEDAQLFAPIFEGANSDQNAIALFIKDGGEKIIKIPSSRTFNNIKFSTTTAALYRNQDEISYMPSFSDTLFLLSDSTLTTKAVFSLGKSKFDPFSKRASAIINNDNQKFYVFELMELPDYFIVEIGSVGKSSGSNTYLVNKDTERITSLKRASERSVFMNNIDGAPLPKYLTVSGDSLLVGFVHAVDLFQWQNSPEFLKLKRDDSISESSNLQNILAQLTQNDNPIIVLYSLIEND